MQDTEKAALRPPLESFPCSGLRLRPASLDAVLQADRTTQSALSLSFGDLAGLKQAVVEFGRFVGNGEDQRWLGLRLGEPLQVTIRIEVPFSVTRISPR